MHGWDEVRADAAAAGTYPVALHVTGLDAAVVEALVHRAGQLGLELLTGSDWALLAGSQARVSALARPWAAPPELADLAYHVGVALPPDPPEVWETARGPLALDRPMLLGVLNVTPDSFSDGGLFTDIDRALAHADQLLADGADVIDVGGESTRPGRPEPVALDEELRRVVPVVEALAARHPQLVISVDTVKSDVARAAMHAGAAVINDVSAFRLDAELVQVARATEAGVILMHSRGTVTDMATLDHADYGEDVVGTVHAELKAALDHAVSVGIDPNRIVLDPGIGFAKSAEQNILLLDRLASFLGLGRPLLVGPSRKRFLGTITGREVHDRDRATAAACVVAYDRGARLFRVHDVAAAREALAVAYAIRGS